MITNPSTFDAQSFSKHLVGLLGNERRVQVEFLIALAEFDRRELYLELGYSRLWEYCERGLHLCKGSTFRRTHSVKLLQRFPQLGDVLRDGRLCTTTLCELEDVLTDDNFERVIAAAAHKSREECERLAAMLKAPAEPRRDSLRRAPKRAPSAQPMLVAESPLARPESALRFEPVAEDDWLLKARLSDRVMTKLRRARELASHVVPDGEAGRVRPHRSAGAVDSRQRAPSVSQP